MTPFQQGQIFGAALTAFIIHWIYRAVFNQMRSTRPIRFELASLLTILFVMTVPFFSGDDRRGLETPQSILYFGITAAIMSGLWYIILKMKKGKPEQIEDDQ